MLLILSSFDFLLLCVLSDYVLEGSQETPFAGTFISMHMHD